MVVQPPIIFGEASQGGTNFDTDYMIGLAFAAVFLASGINTARFQYTLDTMYTRASQSFRDFPATFFWVGFYHTITTRPHLGHLEVV